MTANEFWLHLAFGDRIGIVSLLLTLVGFVMTGIGLFRIKSAADAATEAASSARLKLLSVDVLAALDRVISSVRELQYLHRAKYSISLLHTRYEATVSALLALEADLDAEITDYKIEPQITRSLLSEIFLLQEAIEDYQRTKALPDLVKANITLGKLLAKLQASRENLRARIGGNSGQ